ncbi:class I SAM-dependent methyltransferase [Ideonella livida]|uniref:Methyltransferase domain-containing protein n=1 Tax=Ideonella livida TaxID=2707176 RepID=A0A7C9PGP4_9BURK|nr:methyltransferase domain-containing protein [Ideonella livida]NDY91071.1 methyltransferase domain-containing protein [Ideonella livida]
MTTSLTTPDRPPAPAAPLPESPDAAALRQAARALYRQRAPQYDWELAPFEPLRQEAIASLALQPGQTVLDLGCGTGLSLDALQAAVGPQGQVVGVEQCPDMLGRARQRCQDRAWSQVQLQTCPVEAAELPLADAALFHFTHDILLSPTALAQVFRHLRPGARVVATGLQWAPWWAWPLNLWVWSAAWYSVGSMAGLDQPWRLLDRCLPGLQVEPKWQGSVFMACGEVPPRRARTQGLRPRPRGHTG